MIFRKLLHPFLVALAAGAVLCLAIIGLFPKLVTGDYCKVTVVSIRVDECGQTELVWKGIHSSGTGHYGWASINGVRREGGGGGSGGGFVGTASGRGADVNVDTIPRVPGVIGQFQELAQGGDCLVFA
jgi:hypothetical protein